jgi:hypothetical protein
MKGDKSFMRHFSKMFFFALLALATAVLYVGTANPAYAGSNQVESVEEEETPYSEEEYNAYIAADQEPDFEKRGAMLLAFIEEYPESALMTYIEASYKQMLFECSESEKFQELETLAEQWKKLHPDDLQMTAYIITAANKLGHDEKYVEGLLELYEAQPTADTALYIARSYKKLNNTEKYIEWAEKALAYPEYASDFLLRYDLVQHYVGEQDYDKAAAWARKTLEAADQVKQPSAETATQLSAVRNACYHLIGISQYEAEKFADAEQSFRNALEAKGYGEGYYYIGLCQSQQDLIDDAMISLAIAERHFGGEVAPKAKEYLEKLYKALHNNTLIGIDKVYRKAKEQIESANKPKTQASAASTEMAEK